MAILDNEMIMANALADTTVGAHDSKIIDFAVPGAGYEKKVLLTINTAFASSGSATDAFAIQTAADSAFTSPTTLFSTSAAAYTNFTAGKKVLEYTLPAEVLRYVKVVHTIATAALTAGAYNAWVDDAQQTNMTIL